MADEHSPQQHRPIDSPFEMAGQFCIETEHGIISVHDTNLKKDAPTLLLIHGNSSDSAIFNHIMSDPTFLSTYRMIAFDLPGHGGSSNASDPKKTYNMRGYANVALTVLKHLHIEKVIVFGWSLGGHIAIELIPLLKSTLIELIPFLKSTPIALKGIMITGTPPANGLAQTDRGFTFTDGHMSLAGRLILTEEEIKMFARSTAGAPFEPWMETAVRRTDPKSRYLMWKSFAEGQGLDQISTVQTEDVLIAVVNGAEEPFVNLDYLDEIKWKNLWKGKCARLEGLGHAPFWEKPEEFAELLKAFLEDCSKV